MKKQEADAHASASCFFLSTILQPSIKLVNDADPCPRTPRLVRRVTQLRRVVNQRERRRDVVAINARGKVPAELPFHSAACSSRKRDVRRLAGSANVISAQQDVNNPLTGP